MQTIGERLEEARKRLGISVREASEATKIRGDYLQHMENGDFMFPLPDVYKRGFLKIYGRYLKLDADKLAADFNAQSLSSSRKSRQETRDHLGRVELTGSGAAPVTGEEDTYEGAPAGGLDSGPLTEALGSGTMIKIGAAIAIVLVAVIGLFWLGHRLLSDSSSENSTAAAGNTTAAGTTTPDTHSTTPAAKSIHLTFTASDDISRLTVIQVADGRKLYDGPLTRNQSQPVDLVGRAQVTVTDAQYLTIEQDGKRSAIGVDGKVFTGMHSFYWPPRAAGAAP